MNGKISIPYKYTLRLNYQSLLKNAQYIFMQGPSPVGVPYELPTGFILTKIQEFVPPYIVFVIGSLLCILICFATIFK